MTDETKSQLEAHHPVKSLGQNFLIDQKVADQIVDVINIQQKKQVIEIGPGLGVLTKRVLEKGQSLVALEYDSNLVKALQKEYQKPIQEKQLRIVEGDCLRTYPKLLEEEKIQHILLSNLPYQITTPLFRILFENNLEPKPSQIILMLQKEVVDRLLAKSDSANRGYLSVYLEYYSISRRVLDVPKTAFAPMPKVDSAVMEIMIKPKRIFEKGAERLFLRFVKAGFVARRKLLYKTLTGLAKASKDDVITQFKQQGLSELSRAQELTLDDWVTLYQWVAMNRK